MRTAAAVFLVGTLAIPPVQAGSAAAELGGYSLTAQAAPISLHIIDPVIPIPAEPQLELSLSYSRAKAEAGPTGRAVSSFLWPGDVVGYGLPELLKNPDGHYPVKVDAAHPGGPKDAVQEPVPATGTGMKSHADEKVVEASSTMASHSTPALPALPGLPLPIPAPGLPIPTSLIAMEGVASRSRTEVTADKASATAYSTAGTLSLLGGIIKLHGLRAESSASSDGKTGTSTAKVVWKSITVAGQTFEANEKGITSPAGAVPAPALPAELTKRLAGYGFSIAPPKVDAKNDGATGKVSGQGLTITLDTAVLRTKLGLSLLLDPLLGLLPAEARNQLTPWLNLAPKFVFIMGSASADATASPAYEPEPLPPTDSGTGGSGSPGDGGGSTGGTGDGGTGTSEAPPTQVASSGWPIFPGVPWYVIALGVLFAAGAAYGLRGFVGGLFGAGGCDLGAAGGVPNLRER
ncbi:choice-of-anchor P family protein [Allorhizocola rhizosphaerae]|uniref:choice-of-anchor P family protein n=1 Tax=Allorhizocola rhizosphaerae TaxID=1872709 RepID=UPI0013C33452|nr:choice-of-anchor P family protein [Allorhizocola rhizosphaerae]